LICATGSLRCLAAMMSARLSFEIGLTIKCLLTIKHYKYIRQCIFKLLYISFNEPSCSIEYVSYVC
jgi:hypothetical protein